MNVIKVCYFSLLVLENAKLGLPSLLWYDYILYYCTTIFNFNWLRLVDEGQNEDSENTRHAQTPNTRPCSIQVKVI